MKVLVVHIWLLLLLLCLRNGNLAAGQCSVPTALCCPGSNGCNRGGCYCDVFCMTAGDCCPDYYQTCNQSNSQTSLPSSPSPSLLPSSPTSTSPDSPILGPSSSSSSPTSSSSPSPTPPTSSSSITSSSGNSQPSSPSPPSSSTWTTPDSPTQSSQTSAPSSSSQSTPSPTSSLSIASPSGQCSVPTALCCPGSNGCNRGGCYCDELCMTAGDCCPDYYQTCNQSNSQTSLPSSPSPSLLPSSPTSTSPDSPILGPSSSSSSPSQTSAPTTSSLPSPTPPTSSSSITSSSDCNNCTENEACQERGGVYGCGCLQGQRPNPEIFDAVESCASSTGSVSLSRCQLFESGFYPETLHLNDPSCKGTLENGRLLFYFDNEGHICGTTLTSNSTHFIYQNSIQSNPRNTEQSIISRDIWMNMTFSCAYPLIQTLSMPMGFRAEGGVVSKELPAGQGTYQIRMMPYHDAQFTSPYVEEQVQVYQQMYVAVEVEGVDRNQIATVLDNCWATPVNDAEYHIRWNLISRECPNPEDTTVEVLQNGIDTTSHFSFRMFTFSGISDHVFLHCEVHLCLVQNGRCALSCNHGYRSRRHRSLDFLHSAAISMGLKAQKP